MRVGVAGHGGDRDREAGRGERPQIVEIVVGAGVGHPTNWLALTGTVIDTDTARSWGLVDHVES